jgi:hypothetical protein
MAVQYVNTSGLGESLAGVQTGINLFSNLFENKSRENERVDSSNLAMTITAMDNIFKTRVEDNEFTLKKLDADQRAQQAEFSQFLSFQQYLADSEQRRQASLSTQFQLLQSYHQFNRDLAQSEATLKLAPLIDEVNANVNNKNVLAQATRYETLISDASYRYLNPSDRLAITEARRALDMLPVSDIETGAATTVSELLSNSKSEDPEIRAKALATLIKRSGISAADAVKQGLIKNDSPEYWGVIAKLNSPLALLPDVERAAYTQNKGVAIDYLENKDKPEQKVRRDYLDWVTQGTKAVQDVQDTERKARQKAAIAKKSPIAKTLEYGETGDVLDKYNGSIGPLSLDTITQGIAQHPGYQQAVMAAQTATDPKIRAAASATLDGIKNTMDGVKTMYASLYSSGNPNDMAFLKTSLDNLNAATAKVGVNAIPLTSVIAPDTMSGVANADNKRRTENKIATITVPEAAKATQEQSLRQECIAITYGHSEIKPGEKLPFGLRLLNEGSRNIFTTELLPKQKQDTLFHISAWGNSVEASAQKLSELLPGSEEYNAAYDDMRRAYIRVVDLYDWWNNRSAVVSEGETMPKSQARLDYLSRLVKTHAYPVLGSQVSNVDPNAYGEVRNMLWSGGTPVTTKKGSVDAPMSMPVESVNLTTGSQPVSMIPEYVNVKSASGGTNVVSILKSVYDNLTPDGKNKLILVP